jgi:hypothetical protein
MRDYGYVNAELERNGTRVSKPSSGYQCYPHAVLAHIGKALACAVGEFAARVEQSSVEIQREQPDWHRKGQK